MPIQSNAWDDMVEMERPRASAWLVHTEAFPENESGAGGRLVATGSAGRARGKASPGPKGHR